jgi:hypothetical protein
MRLRLLRVVSVPVILVAVWPSPALAEDGGKVWTRSKWFDEHYLTHTDQRNLRFHVNAPSDESGQPARSTRLIIYALPNGNTIEQTLGCKPAEGLDWHYDIQHVAAQVRLLRALEPNERIVLICAEASGLSWPSWRRDRADANITIWRLVDEWRREFGAENAKITLTGHSGGGSFIFGVIEASDEILVSIDRIAFLDANYSFDAQTHAEKLSRWLKSDDSRRLIVLAYDDREIVLNGEKVVGPTGGTYRATARMRQAFANTFRLAESESPPFHETTGLNGRIRFFVHPNPENKILHTALVGDMNGLVHVQTFGTASEGTWGTFSGGRAFVKWIQPEPTPSDLQRSVVAKGRDRLEAASPAELPPRPEKAVGGREFVNSLEGLSLDAREAAILREITSGNFPEFLRNFKTIQVNGTIRDGDNEKQVTATVDVMPDYLAVGSDADFVRMPMTAQTAQQIANRFSSVLPTRKLVDAIDQQAELHLPPHPLTNEREAVATFREHHEILERQRDGKPLGLLLIGIKKDIVLSPLVFDQPERLAIYGWRQLDGRPIQPLTIVHWNRYVDYSHGVRLIRNSLMLDGQAVKITELLADSNRCPLVSDEGPMDPPAYPLDRED